MILSRPSLFPLFFLIALVLAQSCKFGNFSKNSRPISGDNLNQLGNNVLFRTKGTISALLSPEGAFAVIEIDGIAQQGEIPLGTLLTQAGRLFSFPNDCVGCSVEIEGTVTETSLVNWTLPTTSVAFRLIELTAIEFFCANVCKTFPVNVKVKDLRTGDIHGPNDNVGGGRMCLDPGGLEPLHSTMHSTEIISCVVGTVTVKVDRGTGTYEDHVLSTWDAALIPPGTLHEVINESQEQACYIFVHSLVQV